MQAVILAGGFGTRLKSIIPDLPKPMAPIGDKPFLAFLLDYLSSQGIREIVLSVGYKHDVIMNYFGDSYAKLSIQYSVEDKPLGTGGAIKKALTYTKADLTFILNGDSFLQVDYNALLQQQQKSNAKFMLVLKHVADVSRYGAVNVKDNQVISFFEKGKAGPGMISTGVYLGSREFFNSFDLPETFSVETDFLHRYIDSIKAEAFFADNYFVDIGVPDDYLRAQRELPELMYATNSR
jgi:D-glycero-alpha-D-manno-heptose 1-phosphate guanylyltransferase